MESRPRQGVGLRRLIGALLCGSALGLAGCSDVPRPRVREIESIYTDPTTQWVDRVELLSDGDLLEQVWLSRDGAVTGRVDAAYRDDALTRLELFDGDGVLARTLALGYDGDGVLESIEDVDALDNQVRRSFRYHDELVEEITYTSTTTDPLSSTVTTATWTERYHYDKQSRVDRILTEGFGDAVIVTLSWSDDDSLVGAVTSGIGGDVADGFSYDDDGRLERVSASAPASYQLFYGDDGLVERIERVQGEAKLVSRYFYADGELAGILPTPAVPRDRFFSMEGRVVPALEFVTFELWQ
jgi:hypothetical protein